MYAYNGPIWGERAGCKMYVNQSALPIIHWINGDKQRGGWEDRDLENDWDSVVCVCVCGAMWQLHSIVQHWPTFCLWIREEIFKKMFMSKKNIRMSSLAGCLSRHLNPIMNIWPDFRHVWWLQCVIIQTKANVLGHGTTVFFSPCPACSTFFWIRCVGAGKHPKHAGQGAPGPRSVSHTHIFLPVRPSRVY